MLFTPAPAARLVGVTPETIKKWSREGRIPFGVRPLQDGVQTFYRDDLEYARDVVKPISRNAGIGRGLTRRPAGILAGGRYR